MLTRFAPLLLAAVAFTAASTATGQTSSILTKQYEDGGVYEGTFKDGRQHGIGTYTLPSGYEYTGAWLDGEVEGQGIAKFEDGSVYEGTFSRGKPSGRG